jgi:hypothetical protein
MAGISNDVLTKIETTIATLMVNPIRMMTRKRIIKGRENFIKGGLRRIMAMKEDHGVDNDN